MADKEFSAFVEPTLINQGMLRSLDLTYVGQAGKIPTVAAGEDGLEFGVGVLDGYVVVQSKSDLPTPAGGVITLAANTVYQINGTIALGTDRISIPSAGTYLVGAAGDRDQLTYTGTGDMITIAAGADLSADHVGFQMTGAGARMFVKTGVGSINASFGEIVISSVGGVAFAVTGADVVSMFRLTMAGVPAAGMGSIDADIVELGAMQGLQFGAGLTLAGTGHSVFAFTRAQLIGGTGGNNTLIDFGTSTWDLISIIGAQLVTAEATDTAVSGAIDNGNLTGVGATGELTNTRIAGPGDSLAGITEDDTQWRVFATTGTRDSVVIGTIIMGGNSTATVIGTPGVFVKIAGTTNITQERRFSDGGAANMLKYIGTEPTTVQVRAVTNVIKTGGTEEEGQLQFFLNGSPIGSAISFGVSNKPDSAETIVVADVETGDEFELYITNIDAANNITVTELLMIASDV